MRPKEEAVLQLAIEGGVASGLRRFYKHRDDAPEPDIVRAMAEAIEVAVSDSIHEWFRFTEDGDK